jgi:hypothetical protein
MNYQRVYNQIIERAKIRKLEGYKEKHHVIPKCLGGLDVKENLVELTAREHFLCHQLLCEIYPKNVKLKQALWLMSIGKQKNRLNEYSLNSKTYERLKKEYSKTLIGTKQSLETIEKRKKQKIGFKYSEESKQKMSESKKGKIYSEEHRKKISESKKGKNRNITWGTKISESKKGKTKKGKTLLQIDFNTHEIIKIYPSLNEAIKLTGIKTIPFNISGKTKKAGGYIWKYKN